MERRDIEVTNEHGLHARPAALFVQTAARFSSRMTLRNLSRGGKEANAKSIMEVLTAGVDQGSHIQIEADGDDAHDAVRALADLIEKGLV